MKASMYRPASAVVGVLSALLFGSLALVGQECAVYLLPGASLQEAVDSVEPGGVICLSAGEYAGPLTIGKSLTLRGQGAGRDQVTILGTNQESTAVLVRADAYVCVSFENLTIRANASTALFVDGEASVTLDSVHVTEAVGEISAGVLAAGSVIFAATSCVFSKCAYASSPQLIGAPPSGGVAVFRSNNGVALAGDSSARFERCTFRDNGTGAHISNGCRADFLECQFIDNGDNGLAVVGVAQVRVERCVLSQNGGAGFDSYSGPSTVVVLDSTFADNWAGIDIGWSGVVRGTRREAATVTVIRCQILRCHLGLLLQGWGKMIVSESEISASAGAGIQAQESSDLDLTDCHIAGSAWAGLYLTDNARLTCRNCVVADNSGDGLYIEKKASVEARDCEILRNGGHGVLALGRECTPWDVRSRWFTGAIAGGGNVIPGRFVPDGNGEGAICPGSLELLRTY